MATKTGQGNKDFKKGENGHYKEVKTGDFKPSHSAETLAAAKKAKAGG